MQPMYRAEDIAGLKTTDSLPGEFPYVRGTRTDNDWFARQDIIASSPEEANRIALDVLNKGVTSLGFSIKEASEDELKTLLAGIKIDAVELNFNVCPKKALTFAALLVDYIKADGAEKTFVGSIDFNPFRKALKHGTAFPGDIAAMAVEIGRAHV